MSKVAITREKFTFPTPKKHKIVETGLMLETINTTMAIHPGNAAWYGESRIGKTTTAQYCVKRIMENYDANSPHAFRATHFECGEIAGWSGNEQKKGVKALYNATIGRMGEGMYRMDPIETLVETTVHGLTKKNIRMIFIDEAGNLSLAAIRGMMMCFDAAKNSNYELSLIFVGMDDLPIKLEKLPQIRGRIHTWCYFDKFTLTDITKLLKELYPYFSNADMNKPSSLELVNTIYELFDGFPGLIIPYMNNVEDYLRKHPQELSVMVLKMIHYRNNMNRVKAIEKSKELHNGKPRKKAQSKGITKKKSPQKGRRK